MSEQPKKILVVDDDPLVRELVGEIVRRMGHEYVGVGNAWQALPEIQKPYDLIVLDLRMPFTISGVQLMETLERIGSKVPVIVFSGWTEADLPEKRPDFVQAVVQKPVRLADLEITINSILQRPTN